MTLHEAIKEVLVDSKRELTTSEIAKLINDKKLYVRKDKKLIHATQIMYRVNNYPKLFIKTGNKISLKGYSEQDLHEEEIKNHLIEFVNQLYRKYSFRKIDVLPFLLMSILELDKNSGSISPKDFFTNISRRVEFGWSIDFMSEDIFPHYMWLIIKIHRYSNRNRIIQKIIYWFYDSHNDSDMILLPEYICSIIGGFNFYDRNTVLHTTYNLINNYKLNIFENNSVVNSFSNISKLWQNETAMNISALILGAAHFSIVKPTDKPLKSVGIITPPWGIKEINQEWTSNYKSIMDNLENENRYFEKALLIVPEGAIFTGGKDLNARKILTKDQYVESVVTIPFKSSFTNINSAVLITFDFKNKNEDVFFADLNKLENFDIETEWTRVNDIINNKEIIDGISTMVKTSEILDNACTWMPQKYILKPQEFERKTNHETLPIKSILKNWFRGKNVDRKKLYQGGELKYLRTTELTDDSIFINLTEDILGIDHDEIDHVVPSIQNSVVVTLIGNKLKASVVPKDMPLLFNPHLVVLEVNTNKVLPEFIAHELRESYIQEQLGYYRKGTTIPTISLSDFLELKVQIPSVEIQKDILLSKIHGDVKLETENQQVESKVQAFDYIATLKHTLKQQLKTLSSDLVSLRKFLTDIDTSDKSVKLDDIIVSIFPGEDTSKLTDYKLSKTLDRMSRSLENAHFSLDQAQNALEIESTKKTKFEIKKLLEEIKLSYPKLDIKITGKKQEILADRAQIRIAINNIIDNAVKHGFTEENKPWKVEIKSIPQKSNEPLVIEITNNGEPFPVDFKTEEFLSKGKKAGNTQGSGFGGYLINKIIENHKGKIELIPTKEIEFEKYNVKFIISLPKQ